MSDDIRFSSFFNRVEFEREVLRTINESARVPTQLHSLHPTARLRWIRQAPSTLKNSDIPALLEQCWDHLAGMADHSRNVFEIRPARIDDQRVLLSKVRLRLEQLVVAISS